MNRIKLPILILIISFMTGCSYAKDAQQSSKKQIISAQFGSKNILTTDLIQMTKIPTTPIELLENLKFALDNRLLLREDFYTDENLRKFTGASELNWGRTKKDIPNVIDVSIVGFSGKMRHITSNSEGFSGISLRFVREIKSDTKISAFISSHFTDDDPRLSYQTVESLFGKQWQALKQPRWSSNRIYRAPTAPYGNQEWGYTILRDSIEENTHFIFGPNALVDHAILSLEQK